MVFQSIGYNLKISLLLMDFIFLLIYVLYFLPPLKGLCLGLQHK